MGKLFYGSDPQPIDIDDRLLQYVQVVVATKLRRGESFTLTWTQRDTGAGRQTVWLQPAIPLRFVYATETAERISPAYLRQLADQAAGTTGLMLDLDRWQQQENPTAAHLVAA